MTELWQGLVKAIELVISLDAEVIEIAGRSLRISATSATIAALICLPLGSLIHFHRFPGKRLLINIVQTLFSIPTVAIGLSSSCSSPGLGRWEDSASCSPPLS